MFVALVASSLPLGASAAPGDLYVSDAINGTIVKVTPAGTKSTFASGLDGPRGLAFDRSGNLFVAQSSSGAVSKFAPDGTESTFTSGLSQPVALAFDGSGNLFVTESFGDIGDISKFTPEGVKSTFASDGNLLGLAFDISGNLFASHGGPTDLLGGIFKLTPDGSGSDFASAAGPGLAFGPSGDLFATDQSGLGKIVEISPTGVRTSRGNGF